MMLNLSISTVFLDWFIQVNRLNFGGRNDDDSDGDNHDGNKKCTSTLPYCQT